jgi:ATP-dependent Lon protease
MHGLSKTSFKINDNVLEKIISDYTRRKWCERTRQDARQYHALSSQRAGDKGKLKANISTQDIEKILGRSKYSNELYKMANMPRWR